MMDTIGVSALFGAVVGALWGWYLASERAKDRLSFWRGYAARLQGEGEGMIKALAESNAERESLRGEVALLRCDVERKARKREQDAKRRVRENVMKAGEVGREP